MTLSIKYCVLLNRSSLIEKIESELKELHKLLPYFTIDELRYIFEKIRNDSDYDSFDFIDYYNSLFLSSYNKDANFCIAILKAIQNNYSILSLKILIKRSLLFNCMSFQYSLAKSTEARSFDYILSSVYSDLLDYHYFDIDSLFLEDHVKKNILISTSNNYTKPVRK